MKIITFDVICNKADYAFIDHDGEIFHLIEYMIPDTNGGYTTGYGWTGNCDNFITDDEHLPFKTRVSAISFIIARLANYEQPIRLYKFDEVDELHRFLAKTIKETQLTLP